MLLLKSIYNYYQDVIPTLAILSAVSVVGIAVLQFIK